MKMNSDEMAERHAERHDQPLPAKSPGKAAEDARATGKQERGADWQSAIKELGEKHAHNERGH